MLKIYLITTLRKLNRQKNYTAINVLGLALAMACCLFIFLIVQYEQRFDRFHSKFDRIYRIVTDEKINDITSETMGSPIPIAAALRQDFPNLEKVTATFYTYSGLFTVNGAEHNVKRFQEDEGVAFVEPEFFEIFDFPWLAGNPKSLAEPNYVALTETLAQKFFGGRNPIGQSLRLDNKIDLKVAGIVKDFPIYTDFPFSALLSWKTLPQTGIDVEPWGNLSLSVNTYVVLPPTYSAQEFESWLVDFKEKYHPHARDVNKRVHQVQPLSEVHYDGRYGNYAGHTISKAMLWALGLIGVFLLITACINFVNMATAQAINRAKEVGVRKVLGATVTDILGLISKEFAVLIAVAFAVAAPVAYFVMKNWLENFAYRVDIGLGVFLSTIVVTSIIAVITVGYRAAKAALANPVESLRYE